MKLSIISINRNNASGLERTIQSVIDQDFNDFEYIVIDGDSTDNSVEVIKKFSNKITYWVSEPDSGIYNGMNKGIKQAHGEYCLFLNSGDHLKNKIVLSNVFAKRTYTEDIIYGSLEFVGDKKSSIKEYPDKMPASYLFLDTLPHPSTFIKTDVLLTLGMYNETMRITADHDFFLRAIIGSNASYRRINLVVSVFYCDGLSSSRDNLDDLRKELLVSFQNNFPSFYDDYLNLFSLRKDPIMRYCIDHKNANFFRFIIRILKKFFPTRIK